MKASLLLVCAFFAFPFAMPNAEAQGAYPNKPIRLIVTYPPGGGTDIVARMLAPRLAERLKQQVVIDNRGGAGGIIGTELAARSPADGYTLLFGTSAGLVINPLLNSKLPYDPVKDFVPVSLLVINPQLLVANNATGISSVRELIALAKSMPGKLNYASVGQGSPNHLAMELFKSMAGVDIVHVPYKGAGPAVTDLLGGQVQVMFNPMPPLLPHVKMGKLKAIAVGSLRRSPAVPDIPTVDEAGLPGYEYVLWYGMFGPAGMPVSAVNRLNAELVKLLAESDIVQRLASRGVEARSSTPGELANFMREESVRLAKVIRSAGIKVE
jgi:tripartite-type tricarboxylate transporter receptor subunit TctC